MAERVRERDRTAVFFANDEARHIDDDLDVDDEDMRPDVTITDEDVAMNEAGGTLRDGLTKSEDFATPLWLNRKLPLVWSDADSSCRKSTSTKPGRNCCLFAPLSYCTTDMDVINGFCSFHLRAIFNLTYQNDALYQLNSKGEAVLWFRAQCYVADPRPVDNRSTSCFPIFELFASEPRLNDIQLWNLKRYLVSIGAPNWEKIYSSHVNFLHRLITVHSNFAQPASQLRHDHLLDNQLILHWNLWNEYYSWVLKRIPAQLYLFYVPHQKRDEVVAIPVSKCTTLTQMIVRLFAEPYTRLDDQSFHTGPANYSLCIKRHLAYSDNMCSYGTTTTASNFYTIGALATLPMLRTDSCRDSVLWYDKGVNCGESFRIDAKMNADTMSSSLQSSIVSSTDASSTGIVT